MAEPTTADRTAEETARLEALAANTIRGLTIDAVEAAQSGHPGLPMGMADAAVVLWSRFLKHDPKDPAWPDRDRFVLSAGHGSMLVYSLLHLAGYDLPMEELKNFRQLRSKTPGHPENFVTTGVETTTGPLGQGIANAVGMAIAEKHLAATFNTDGRDLVDHYTYVIASDGDLMEGVSNEASSLAGHLGLGKLIVLYDDNEVTIDGYTDLAFSEDVGRRYEALGWHVLGPIDGHDRDAVEEAIHAARAETERPSLIACRTKIGFGSPKHEGTPDIHSDPIGGDEIAATKERLGLPADRTFYVPDDAATLLREQAFRGMEAHCGWQGRFNDFKEANPELAADFERRFACRLPDGWADALPSFEPDAKGMATRAASGKVLGALVPALPELMGGSADLTPSNKTRTDAMRDFSREHPEGRYLRFGVREHAMGAILNGLTLHGGVRGYGGTFLVFSDYMRPTIRLAALMGVPSLFVFTHDSVGLGEDGPTHQPIEHLMSLRAIPNLPVFRPCDANETAEAWRLAIERTDGPSVFAFTRQNVPTLDRSRYAPAEGARRGAYVLSDCEGTPDVLLLATGSEVHLALEAQEQLEADGVAARVVSMPCWELFDEQDASYRDEVIPPGVTARVGVEAGATLGWYKYVGMQGAIVGLDRFGASAPWEEVYEALGLTAESVADAARRQLGR